LAALPGWQQARVFKANPDQVRLPVRVRALRKGKLGYRAVPKLADLSSRRSGPIQRWACSTRR
jgi:5-formyltetrahydrofolate cyclo-ligase